MEKKQDKSPLVSLNQIYCSCDKFQLYIINNEGTKLKNIISGEVKEMEDEVKFIDILMGEKKTAIDPDLLNDFRRHFKIKKQIGYNRECEFDFISKVDIEILYKLSLFKSFQTEQDKRAELTDF